MSRVRSVLAITLLMTMLGGGTSAASAERTSAAGAERTCGAGGHTWPQGEAAHGITFVGRVTGTSVQPNGTRVYRFHVLKRHAGPPLRDRVNVLFGDCVETRFKVGGRYLVSSARGGGHDGLIEEVDYRDEGAVAWRVWPTNHVELMGYGPGTPWDETPAYLRQPERLHEAIDAVTS